MSFESPESSHPTLCFPPPPPHGAGTHSLCSRCLTLLSHLATHFGDGTRYESIIIPHSSSIASLIEAEHSNSGLESKDGGRRNDGLGSSVMNCVICTKTLSYFRYFMAKT